MNAPLLKLPLPVGGTRFDLRDSDGKRLVCYADGNAKEGTPLLLVHSVNAAASAYEMKPLYEHYGALRPTYAFDLPGFGQSDRSDRDYTPRLMTDAVHAVVSDIRARHGGAKIDILGLSLGCEFVGRAARETPEAFASVGLISPTGFDARAKRAAKKPGQTRAMPWLKAFFRFPLWKRGFFSALTSRASIRFFLRKTWGSKNIDEGLLDYDYIATHQPGAENAPYHFVSGYLFSTDALRLYTSLTMPCWLAHGVRGDFVDYSNKSEVEGRPNWRISVFQTGAMPQFELPAAFVVAYDRFLADVRNV